MDDMTVRKGATLPITVTNDEDGAVSALLTISKDDVIYKSKSASFVDDVADLTLSTSDTDLPLGVYDYMITVTYDDGTVEKYPDTDACESCTLPTLTVCEANDVVVS
jgi:hypothetical protein